jgi:hypothetical protein
MESSLMLMVWVSPEEIALARSAPETTHDRTPHSSVLTSGRFASDLVGSAMAEVELTEEMITAAMAKADARVCVGSDRCYAFPDRLEDARASCTAKGRCKVGWIIGRGGRESWDVWLEVSTGLVKLVPQADV